MKLMPAAFADVDGHGHEGHDHEHEAHDHEHDAHDHAHGHSHAVAGGIEWEDDMVDVNRMTTPANMRWKLIDRQTDGRERRNDWRFRVGDRVKIRLLNEMAGDHPMHHPFHVHGAGRFRYRVVTQPEPNLVWKDTVLVRIAETVDILLDLTNVGRWMAYRHIAEHHERHDVQLRGNGPGEGRVRRHPTSRRSTSWARTRSSAAGRGAEVRFIASSPEPRCVPTVASP